MKKPETAQSTRHRIVDAKAAYYKEVGENAALCAFTKKKHETVRLNSISPRIKRFLSPDSKATSEREMRILRDLKSRDVSHLRDRVSSPTQKVNDLPADLEVVKKLVLNSDKLGNPLSQGSPISTICRKDICLEEVYKASAMPDKFYVEKMLLGSPSGRQECENLKKWLEIMMQNYCGDDIYSENGRVIFSMCSKELIRQVSVNCIERGNLLQEVVYYYHSLYDKIGERLKQAELTNETLIRNFTIQFADKERAYLDQIAELEKTEENLTEKVRTKKQKILILKKKQERQEKMIEELKEKYSIKEDQSLKFNHFLKRATSGLPKDSYAFNRSARNPEPTSPPIIKISEPSTPFLYENGNSKRFTQTTKPSLEIVSHYEFNVLNAKENNREEIIIEVNEADVPLDKSDSPFTVNNISENDQESPRNKTMIKEDRLLEPPALIRQDIRKRSSPKKILKKEASARMSEFDKKINEKQNELQRIVKKIKVKYIELEFLTKTVEYKQLKEAFFAQRINKSPSDLTFDQILQRMPSKRKEFNILADLNFWNEDGPDRTHTKSKVVFNRSSTQNYDQIPLLNLKEDQLNNMNLANYGHKERKIESDRESEPMEVLEEEPEDYQKSMMSELESERNDSFDEKNFQKNFQKKEISPITNLVELVDINLIRIKKFNKRTSAMRILQKICEKDLEFSKSKAVMSRKLINRLVLSLLLAFYSRHDYSEDFLDFVYFDFYQRYGLKFVSDKKFVEFICSLIQAEDSKKCSTFLRFIGAGQKINKSNFSKKSFEIYLESLSFLINSKIGYTGPEDFYSDKMMVPVSRTLELVKEKLEKIDRGQINRVISLIEVRAVPDPKKINPSGLIDSEIVLEIIVEAFESLKNKYIDGVEFIVNAIKYSEPKDVVLKNEIAFVIRAIYPDRVEEFEKYFEEENNISVEDLCFFAVDKNIFSINEIKLFYEDQEKSLDEAEQMIKNSLEEMSQIVADIENTERYMKTLPQQLWETKVKNLVKGIYDRKPFESIFAFKIYFLELVRINSTFL